LSEESYAIEDQKRAANARAIAALPELIEAARRVLKWAAPISGDNRDDPAAAEEIASVDALSSALKKADGQ
jgi:hypothetical protein